MSGIEILNRSNKDHSTFWAYTFKAERRDELIQKLESKGIGSMQIHPRNDKWSIFETTSEGELPGVDEFHRSEISIPSGWWVSDEDRTYIVSSIREGW